MAKLWAKVEQNGRILLPAAVRERLGLKPGDEVLRRDLGNVLVLRWSAPEDVEAVAALYAQVFRRSADAPPGWIVPVWVTLSPNSCRP